MPLTALLDAQPWDPFQQAASALRPCGAQLEVLSALLVLSPA